LSFIAPKATKRSDASRENPNKILVFENYWWMLIVAAVVVAGIMVWLFRTENQVTTPLTLLGSIFSLLYFIQKQYRSKNLNDIKTLQNLL
jgi:sensor domain CHASE-containing protein